MDIWPQFQKALITAAGIKTHLITIALTAIIGQGYSQNWLPVGEGLMCFGHSNNLVHDIVIDTTNGFIYVRGDIAFDGDCDTMRTAVRWNGEQWEGMGPPLGMLHGSAIGIYKNKVYASGNWWGINPPNYEMDLLGCWNGSSWDSIPGSPPYISLIEEHNDDLYVAGSFDSCADFQTKLITRYHNGEWEKIAPYFHDDTFYGLAMAIYKDTLYIGGKYDADPELGAGINNAAKVYNAELHVIGHGLNGNSIVEAMVVHNDTLFLGGSFSPGNFDTGEQSYLVTYANGKLEPYPIQTDGRIVALKTYGNALYAAGWFYHAGDSLSPHIVKLKQGNIEVLNRDSLFYSSGTLITIGVRDIEIYDDTLYMVGGFYAIGQDTALNCIAKLNRSLGGPVSVTELTLTESDLSVFPNPSGSFIRVSAESEMKYQRLFDLTGKLVLERSIRKKEASIDISSLGNGLYLLQVQLENGQVLTERVMVE